MVVGSSFMTTFALEQRPRFTRAGKPKSRNGCHTCRRRHTKCDEGKPACQTCLKYQGFCTGYDTKKRPEAVQHRPVVPKLAGTEYSVLVEPSYASLIFPSQLEKDHLDYWRSFTQTTHLFNSEILSQILPQISWADPVIKNAALAIGAAALETTRERRIAGKGRDHTTALTYYGKALKLLYSSPTSHERALLACFLFVTFESLQGNMAAGLNHINHGVTILEQAHVHNSISSSLLGGIVGSFRHIAQYSWALNGVHPQETETQVPWCCRGRRKRYAIDEIPLVFATLEEACYWGDIARHHVEHHGPLYTKFQVRGSSWTAQIPRLPPSDYGSPSSARRIRSYMPYFDRWNRAFIPLAIKAEEQRQSHTESYYKAVSLRIHYLFIWVGVRTAGWTDVEEAGKVEAAFADIVGLSRQLLEAQAARSRPSAETEVFTMEDSPTWPLASSYRLSASLESRRKIMQLFREFPRRDVLFDTRAFLAMMEWLDEMASAGALPEDDSPVSDAIVFDQDKVSLRRRVWDAERSRWTNSDIAFSF
ncbi:Aspercryptin biosynthesis cluster-specific transcription regulator atnN [Colletotrichum trifolii]|uniref:Aspercryptin biosynthesis cluster-specific transcription regulator atnN n=1 Tax=Colletotrichum trifolii TaxID=5466 RepID=A0A4R8RI82_COLTR|nr:Aspercryptin biosynthesis cluster-specific transcription regulator atnN [Colletotrichum trifolii]